MSNDTKQSWFKQHKVLTGVLGFVLFIFIIAPFMDDGSKPSVSSPEVKTAPSVDYQSASLNEMVDLGSHTMKVLSVREADTISSTYKSRPATEGAKFLLLEVELTSTSLSDFSYRPDNHLRLQDFSSRSYTHAEDVIRYIDDTLLLEKLSPGVPKKGTLVYEVPDTSDNSYFKLFAANGNTGGVTMILLVPNAKDSQR